MISSEALFETNHAAASPEPVLKILHVIASVNPRGGGPIEGISQMAEAYRSSGNTVEICSLDNPTDEWVRQCPITCHAMGPSFIGNYRYAPRAFEWLRAHRRNYNLIVVNGIWQYHGFAVWRALRGTDTPYVVFTHGMLDPWFKRTYPVKHLKKWLFWPWADYRMLRDAQAVCFTCEEERRLAAESFWLYRAKGVVVPYGTNPPPAAAASQRAAFLAQHPQLATTRNILFLGRVQEKKGADLVIQAFARLLSRQPEALRDVRLVMAGPHDHAYGAGLKALSEGLGLQDHVVWTGMVRGDLKWGAFRSAEAFVLASHQENFGIAVAEALACGVPVLISRQVNIWREIEQAGAGLVDDDTVDGAERLLERWLDMSGGQRAAMAAAAEPLFRARFLIGQTAETIRRMAHTFKGVSA